MGIDVIPTEAISIPDGEHTGKVQELKEEIRGEGKYTYIDVYITVDGLNKNDGSPVVIKDGMSKHLSKGSKLGKACMRFGLSEEDLDKGIKEEIPIDVTKFLQKDKAVRYMVLNETKEGKTYARVVDGSLKPKEPAEEPFKTPAEPEKAEEPEPKKETPTGASANSLDEIYEAFGPG